MIEFIRHCVLFLTVQIFSERSDVWSFGIFLWEVYSFGRTPYPSIVSSIAICSEIYRNTHPLSFSLSRTQLSEKVLEFLEDGDVMDCPDGCPEGVYDIMVQCWEMEPSLRPTFHSLQSLLAKSFGVCVCMYVCLSVCMYVCV